VPAEHLSGVTSRARVLLKRAMITFLTRPLLILSACLKAWERLRAEHYAAYERTGAGSLVGSMVAHGSAAGSDT
jgi:hypothetical protein